jgi:hypothetical protein
MMPPTSGSLEQAVDTYSRAAFQMWFLPVNVWRAFKGESTLQTTQFAVTNAPEPDCHYELTLSQPLAPGLSYAGKDEGIPTSAVRIEPSSLGPGESTFRLLIEGHALHQLPGATYWGEVTVTDGATGGVIEQKTVWFVLS